MSPRQARRRDVVLIVASGILTGAGTADPRRVDWSKALRVDVTMVEYRFIPNHLTFRPGIPYRLHLETRQGAARVHRADLLPGSDAA